MTEPFARRTLDRVPSGVPGLDTILRGGFIRGGTYMILGRPGAGKTTLGNQISFNHVRDGGRALYVTLLAESHATLLTSLESFSFFRPEVLAASLKYVSGYKPFDTDKLKGVRDLIARGIREHRASVLVIDGFVTAGSLAGDEIALKEFIHELQAIVALQQCTSFLLTGAASSEANYPERTMVDGLLQLTVESAGARSMREIEVLKFRGSEHLMGRHSFEIGPDGLEVYPRAEAVFGARPGKPDGHETVSIGSAPLDALLNGGLPARSNTLVMGAPGSGKTLLGLQFLAAGARLNERGLHVGLFEPPAKVIEGARLIGLDLAASPLRDLIDLDWHAPLELNPDALAHHLIHKVRQQGARRVVIDGVGGLKQSVPHPERISTWLTAVCNELRSMDVTTMVIEQNDRFFGAHLPVPPSGISAMADNVLLLRCVEANGEVRRVFSVFKIRGRRFDGKLRELLIEADGLRPGATIESLDQMRATTTGTVHSRGQGDEDGSHRR